MQSHLQCAENNLSLMLDLLGVRDEKGIKVYSVKSPTQVKLLSENDIASDTTALVMNPYIHGEFTVATVDGSISMYDTQNSL